MMSQSTLRKSERTAPEQFRDWHYGNIVLWYQGDVNLLSSPMASVVGTRQPTEEGLRRARKLTNILIQQNFTIVSGLAAGIDAAAHQQTLAFNGRTIAVMGTPIDECYPAEHKELKRRIAESGLVLSQFPPGTRVFPSNFPQRNILMAALSAATFVVEADADSGTRHQVQAAVRMGRCVGFLASLVDKNIPWVGAAIDSGAGFVIENSDDVVTLLRRATSVGARQASTAGWTSLIEINEFGKTSLMCDRELQQDFFEEVRSPRAVPAAHLKGTDPEAPRGKSAYQSIIVSLLRRLFRRC